MPEPRGNPESRAGFGVPAGWITVVGAGCFALVAASVGCRTGGTGAASFELLPGPDPLSLPGVKASPSDERDVIEPRIRVVSVPARPRRRLRMPDYPPAALAAPVGQHVVYVTITIDESGVVKEVLPSMTRITLPSSHAEDFMNAIRTAVAMWEFSPARNVYWETHRNGDDTYLRAEPVAQMLDVKFTFEETGVVR